MNREQMKRRDELAETYAKLTRLTKHSKRFSFIAGYNAGFADAKIQCISDMVDHPAYQTSKQIEKEFENYRDESFIRERELKQQVADYEAALKQMKQVKFDSGDSIHELERRALLAKDVLNKYGLRDE